MQFTDEVNWDVADFVIFGVLLFGVGITYELAARKTGNAAFKTAIGLAIFAAFLQFWMNGAVGIIGSEDNDVNLMFLRCLADCVDWFSRLTIRSPQASYRHAHHSWCSGSCIRNCASHGVGFYRPTNGLFHGYVVGGG